MNIESFGELSIEVKPIGVGGAMEVLMTAKTRKGVVKMETNRGETVEQLVKRMKGMMTALWNNEQRDEFKQKNAAAAAPPQNTYEQDKQQIKK